MAREALRGFLPPSEPTARGVRVSNSCAAVRESPDRLGEAKRDDLVAFGSRPHVVIHESANETSPEPDALRDVPPESRAW